MLSIQTIAYDTTWGTLSGLTYEVTTLLVLLFCSGLKDS